MTKAPKKPGWLAILPDAGKRSMVSHRYSIAGRTDGAARSVGPRPSDSKATDPGMVSEAMRARMVERVAQGGVRDATVLRAMQAVPRHLFVEPGLQSRAYEDCALPIGHGQTISQPYIVARMIELLRSGRQLGRVLEIGTGCGYQAAVLGQVAQMVFSVERVKALHDLARTNLRPLRLANVRLQFGDGMQGMVAEAPFDGIIVAAAGMAIPDALLEQLAVGGRLIAPVASPDGSQRLVKIEREGAREWKRTEVDGVHFVPLLPGTA